MWRSGAQLSQEPGGALADELLDVEGHQVDAALGEFAEAGDVVHGHAGTGDADDFALGQRAVDDLGVGGVRVGRDGIAIDRVRALGLLRLRAARRRG